MPQNYASFSTKLLSLFTTLFINDVASSCEKKIKAGRVNFSVIFMLLGTMTAGHKAVTYTICNGLFKTQSSFLNHYLAYASSRGIGGGGGHGNAFV